MPIDFPSSPSAGQQYSYGGILYVYSSQGAWVNSAIVQSASTPVIIPSGTLMLFQQTAAPTGWTKQTAHNDKSLRVVSGAAASGGVQAFSTVFGRTASDAFTLTQAVMPSHAHSVYDPGHLHASLSCVNGPDHYDNGGGEFQVWGPNTNAWYGTDARITSVSLYGAGSDGAHSHGLDIRVLYVDVIIASKD